MFNFLKKLGPGILFAGAAIGVSHLVQSTKAGADFGEEAFPIIRALMYLDGLVLRTHPDVKLIESMGPYLEEFRLGLNLNEKISELKV